MITHTKNLIVCAIMLGAINLMAAPILVMNEKKEPIANAQVVVGYDINNPFSGNTLTTNDKGIAEIPNNWDRTLPLTVIADGYLRTSYINAPADLSNIQLTKAETRQSFEVKGDATNFGNLKSDGRVDFAIVYPAITQSQFSRFDVSSVLSMDFDILRILSREIAIPSNVSLPRQSENYVLPIDFNKPTYRMNVKSPGQYKMVATRGQFPLRQVVGDLRDGKSFFEVMKHFKFLGGGDTEVVVTGDTPNQNINVSTSTFDSKVTARGVTGLPSDLLQLSFAVVENQGLYSATDLKQIDQGQTAELVMPARREGELLISLLISKNDASSFQKTTNSVHELLMQRRREIGQERPAEAVKFDPISSAYFLIDNFVPELEIPAAETSGVAIGGGGISLAKHEPNQQTPVFLNIISRPTVSGEKVNSTPPVMVAGLEPVATRVFLSELEQVRRGDKTVDLTYRIREVTLMGWHSEINLPKIFGNLDPQKRYKWEVFYTARMTNSKNGAEYFLDDVTHVSRNSISM